MLDSHSRLGFGVTVSPWRSGPGRRPLCGL